MFNRTKLLASVAIVGALAVSGGAEAHPDGVKVGVLTCHVNSGWGYVLGSSKDVHCNYRPNLGEPDFYDGSISKLGVDIGYTRSAVIVWDVVAPTSDMRAGDPQGDYAGATASATVAVGVGAHVLFGGFDKSIALQPVSIEGNTGLDIAAGIGALVLRHVEPPAPPPRIAAMPERSFGVTFDFNRNTLTRESHIVIAHAAEVAQRTDARRIFVTGHADRVGSESYNKDLSLARAEAVKAEMVRDGVSGDAVYIAGHSFNDPVIPTPPGVHEREDRGATIDLDETPPRAAER